MRFAFIYVLRLNGNAHLNKQKSCMLRFSEEIVRDDKWKTNNNIVCKIKCLLKRLMMFVH